MPVINRTLSDTNLQRFRVDFKNLIKAVSDSQGELDIAIRNEYIAKALRINTMQGIPCAIYNSTTNSY